MFYHVSKEDHGSRFRFVPKNPKSAIVNKEGNIPRVCVCPDIFYCLRAIGGSKRLFSMDIILECRREDGGISHPTIYGTEEIPYLPPRVSDFRKNHEHWFIRPITMKRVGYLDLVALTKGKITILKKYEPVPDGALNGIGKDVLISEAKNVQKDEYDLQEVLNLPLLHHGR